MATESPITSIRERIIAEFITRIKGIDTKAKVNRGFAGVEIQQFPSQYIFEGQEKWIKGKDKHKNMYTVSLPIDHEFFLRTAKGEEYDAANKKLEEIRNAIETDERFSDLCVSFGIEEVELILFRDAIIDVSVRWIFKYVTRFKGTR